MMTEDSVMLDPRLSTYIKKKRYYAENDIDPVVPLEEQYSISDNDRRTIRAYLKGDFSTFKRRSERNPDLIDPTGQQFPSSKFKYDERYDRLKKKIQKDIDAKTSRNDYGIMRNKYDMYDSSRDYASPVGTDRARYFDRKRSDDFAPTDHYKDEFLLDSRDEVENPFLLKAPKSKRIYNNPPKIQYKLRQHYTDPYRRRESMRHDNNIQKIIGDVETYRKKVNRNYEFSSDMDLDTKVVTPYMSCKKTSDESAYQSVPYLSGGNIRDVDVDSYVRHGIPSRGSKTLGYNNPADHYFQFISSDIQDPDHVVMERGTATRLYNKQIARPKKRVIY